ncbi:MAG: hypothetical protein SD837_09700 [Candidatus Electrothrix scaldis]|nr:MAG: hypothetical protein SD837_09700 [Candidatus Electrothrix sp. GW3-3]
MASVEALQAGVAPQGNTVIMGLGSVICRMPKAPVGCVQKCVRVSTSRFAAVTAEPIAIPVQQQVRVFLSVILAAARILPLLLSDIVGTAGIDKQIF